MSTLPAAATPQPSTLSLAFIERIRGGVSIEELRELYRFQREIEADANRAAYADDFAKMQGELPEAPREGRIEIGRGKPQTYAKWEDINGAIKPAMTKYGFALHFRCAQETGHVSVTAILTHRLGHSEQTTLRLPYDSSGSKNAVQSVGSSLSYAKRYTAGLLLNWASRDEDDDGEAGGGRQNPHVNRPEDFVDVPPPDDPDSIPPNPNIKPLPKKDARADNAKLQQEMQAITDPEKLKEWGAANRDRVAAQPLDWQEIFRGLYRNHLIALRSEGGGALRVKLVESAFADLDNAYENCEDAAGFFDIDEKMYQPLLPQLSPTDQQRAGKIRERHMARFSE